jgi:hypothetical protein
MSRYHSTQQTSTQASSSQVHYDLEETNLKKKAQECVDYIMFCYLADRKSIIRKADLNKNVLKDHSRSFRAVFKLVEDYLKNVFGMTLVDMDKDKGEKFFIRSKFEFDSSINNFKKVRTLSKLSMDSSAHESDRIFQEQIKYGFVLISLALIFMNGNEMNAELFWESMKKLDINKDEKRNKYIGDVSKYFTSDLVREGFLEYEPIRGIEPPEFKFKWGPRATLEITKKKVLEFVCEMYGGSEICKPDEWIAQYSEASKCDEENFAEN